MNIFYNLFVNRKKSIIEFNNLDQTKNLKAAKETLVERLVYILLFVMLLARCILEVL
jgi:hypothetical protein